MSVAGLTGFGQLSRMTEQARRVIGSEAIEAVADRGYYSGEEILACEQAARHCLPAEAADIWRQRQRALRQAGLRLCRCGRRLSLPPPQ